MIRGCKKGRRLQAMTAVKSQESAKTPDQTCHANLLLFFLSNPPLPTMTICTMETWSSCNTTTGSMLLQNLSFKSVSSFPIIKKCTFLKSVFQCIFKAKLGSASFFIQPSRAHHITKFWAIDHPSSLMHTTCPL